MNAAAWQGPPRNVLGHPARIQQFVARSDHAIVALQHAIAFPEGCRLGLQVAVRRGVMDSASWSRLVDDYKLADPNFVPDDADLKFGVHFPDGTRATAVGNAFRGWAHPTDRPQAPMLVETGSTSSSSDQIYESERQLWLWPLPPPVQFEFVIEWRRLGIDTTLAPLNGTAIVQAAAQAQPYWP
ncbi:hypothetical protein [Actinomadura rupiterrae]|uniref:hypothetical protein n=1 Tax=Actinomadura rupiterrae TaxID=559627 RepID=UPI0020A4FEAC|nr:hypothetical protein [Actinomadura rupiterrae]MCP2342699.1 hypothetical protein [Actinomadura rupiterrae]